MVPNIYFQVQVEVESMDKGGNFIGYMHADGINLSVSLVEEGLAKVHFTAERGNYYKPLTAAEEKAKSARKNVSYLQRRNFKIHARQNRLNMGLSLFTCYGNDIIRPY